MVADLAELELDEPVDVVFSSAIFHWVLDHDALFARAARGAEARAAAWSPSAAARATSRDCSASSASVAAREPEFAAALRGLRASLWNFADAGGDRGAAARRRLRARSRCWLAARAGAARAGRVHCAPSPRPAPRPPAGGAARPFVEAVLALEDDPLVLDYVRLNIERARA